MAIASSKPTRFTHAITSAVSAQRAMAAALVKTLYERGFARDIPEPGTAEGEAPDAETAERFAAQIAYVDHYADGAPERFVRFRTTRVAVLGDDEAARWCALSLLRNGCARIATTTRWDEVDAEAAEVGATAGLLGGIWALGILFLLPAKNQGTSSKPS